MYRVLVVRSGTHQCSRPQSLSHCSFPAWSCALGLQRARASKSAEGYPKTLPERGEVFLAKPRTGPSKWRNNDSSSNKPSLEPQARCKGAACRLLPSPGPPAGLVGLVLPLSLRGDKKVTLVPLRRFLQSAFQIFTVQVKMSLSRSARVGQVIYYALLGDELSGERG